MALHLTLWSLLVVAAFQATVVVDAEAQVVGAPKKQKTLDQPVLEPTGVTAEQAALDHACERRSQLPRAVPVPEAEAIGRTGRAHRQRDSLTVGKYSFPAATSWVEYGCAYSGRYAARKTDILLCGDGESGGWKIVDADAGTLDLPSLLIPSPNGKVWATAGDFEAPDGNIMLYSPGPTSWTKLADMPIAYPCDLRWIDSKTLSFRTSEGFYKPLGPERHVTLEAGKWVLKP